MAHRSLPQTNTNPCNTGALGQLTLQQHPPSQATCKQSTMLLPPLLLQEAVPTGDTKPLPGIAFTHIPLPEFMAAWAEERSWGHKYEKVRAGGESCVVQSPCGRCSGRSLRQLLSLRSQHMSLVQGSLARPSMPVLRRAVCTHVS
jgi:hypothetical protein